MPISDKFLILSGKSTSAGYQMISAAAGSSSTAGPYSPFDTGLQISSNYGQSPYQTANKNPVTAILGQAVKKFFFLVNASVALSAAAATTGVTIALQAALTAAATYSTMVQSGKIIGSTFLTAAVFNPAIPLFKVPISEMLLQNRFIKGLFTTSSATAKLQILAELTTY